MRPGSSDKITIARADLTAEVSRALIASLNRELDGLYSEPGATAGITTGDPDGKEFRPERGLSGVVSLKNLDHTPFDVL